MRAHAGGRDLDRLAAHYAWRSAGGRLRRDRGDRADRLGAIGQLAVAVRGELELGERLERAAEAVAVGAARLGDALLRRPRAALQRRLDLRRGLPASRRWVIASTSRIAAREQADEAADRLALLGQRQKRGVAAGPSPATSASTRPHTWRSEECAALPSTTSRPMRAPRPELDRELLELAQSRCWRSPTRPPAPARRRGRAATRAWRPRPAASAAGPWPSARARRRRPRRPSRRPSRARARPCCAPPRDRRRRSSCRARSPATRAQVRLDLGLLPALGAVDDEEAAADGERHRVQRAGDRLGRRGVALEALDAAAARLALGQRAQRRPPLADAAVVVAVDEVGGLEGGHRPSSLGSRGGRTESAHPGGVHGGRAASSSRCRRAGAPCRRGRCAARPARPSRSAVRVDGVGWP